MSFCSLQATPFALGYRMPAEWEKHGATWLTWPKDPRTFPARILPDVEQVYLKMIEELAIGELVNLLVDDRETEERVSKMLKSDDNVVFHKIHTSDVWVRDYGPIFVKSPNDVAATKWVFNAWGNKYTELKSDNESGMRIAESAGFRIFEGGLVLEGGSVDVNGLGTGVVTKQCLLNSNRNPQLNEAEIAERLKEYLGITNIIWLDSGIAGDDTDGHVDDVARFVGENTILCMTEEDEEDENFKSLKRNRDILSQAKDQSSNKIDVIQIRMPKRVNCEDGRLPASYANFYIGNVVVLVPTYNDSNDRMALDALRMIFPDRRVIGINCTPLIYGFGAIHCVTQQQPHP